MVIISISSNCDNNSNNNNPVNNFLESRILIFLGDISFPGYLFQMSLRKIIAMLFFDVSLKSFKDIRLILLSTFGTICLSYIINNTIENYYIKFSKNIFKINNEHINNDKSKDNFCIKKFNEKNYAESNLKNLPDIEINELKPNINFYEKKYNTINEIDDNSYLDRN